jgi:hypothetical protein
MFIIKASCNGYSAYLFKSLLDNIFWETYIKNATTFDTIEECNNLIYGDDLNKPFTDDKHVIRPPKALYLFNGIGEDVKLEVIEVTYNTVIDVVKTFPTKHPKISIEY